MMNQMQFFLETVIVKPETIDDPEAKGRQIEMIELWKKEKVLLRDHECDECLPNYK